VTTTYDPFHPRYFDEVAEWFETLAKAERSHAGRFTKGLEPLPPL